MVFYLKCKFVFSLLNEFRYIRMYLENTYMLIIFFRSFRDSPIPFIRTKVNDFNFGCNNINFISSQCIYAISPCLPLPFLNFMTHTQLILYFPFIFLLTFLSLCIFLLSSLTKLQLSYIFFIFFQSPIQVLIYIFLLC